MTTLEKIKHFLEDLNDEESLEVDYLPELDCNNHDWNLHFAKLIDRKLHCSVDRVLNDIEEGYIYVPQFHINELASAFEKLNFSDYLDKKFPHIYENGYDWDYYSDIIDNEYYSIKRQFGKLRQWIRSEINKYVDEAVSDMIARDPYLDKDYKTEIEESTKSKIESHLAESLLDNPFTIERISDEWYKNMGKEYRYADVIVDKIKPIEILFDKNFKVDKCSHDYGQRQLDYLKRHRNEISNKLMELSGLSEQQRLAQIKQNNLEKMSCRDFLKDTSYSKYAYYFKKYMQKAHLPLGDEDFYKSDLENAWRTFYSGNWSRDAHFEAGDYFSRLPEEETNGLNENEFIRFMYDCGYSSTFGGDYWTKYFSLKELDEEFKKFKKLKRKDSKKVEESIKMNKITESILDRSFTIKWQDNPALKKYNDAIVSVEGLKDMYIKVGKNFRIDLGKYEECGKRQINYLENHYYDISEKLMELSGMSNDQIQVCLEKLKAEKGTSCTSFLSEFKPKYQNFNSEFCSFVRRHHLDFNDNDNFYTFAIEDLKESWEKFYTGGDSWVDRLCLFYPAQYLYKINKNDAVNHEKWEDFMFHSTGGRRLEYGVYYTLQTLDEAFEKFEENKINMNKNLELTLAESFEKTFKDLQKEGLFENVESFDLSLSRKGINIKLNESSLSKDEIIEKLNDIYYEVYDIAKEERDEKLYHALYDLGAIYNEEDLDEQGRELERIVRNAGWSEKADLIHNLRMKKEDTYKWGANFDHDIDDDRADNKDNPDYIAKPDKLFKSEEAAQTACSEYCDANPCSSSEVLYYDEDKGWQVLYGYEHYY